MFSLCKQSAVATGIEFSIKCRFFNNDENLVLAGANVLKVYRLIPHVDAANVPPKKNFDTPPKMRLGLFCKFYTHF